MFYIAVPIGLLAIYLIRFIHSFLTDESGFYRLTSSSSLGVSSEGGTGGGGASNISSLESNGLKKGQNWSDGDCGGD